MGARGKEGNGSDKEAGNGDGDGRPVFWLAGRAAVLPAGDSGRVSAGTGFCTFVRGVHGSHV